MGRHMRKVQQYVHKQMNKNCHGLMNLRRHDRVEDRHEYGFRLQKDVSSQAKNCLMQKIQGKKYRHDDKWDNDELGVKSS